jgi:hypothetical protein
VGKDVLDSFGLLDVVILRLMLPQSVPATAADSGQRRLLSITTAKRGAAP